ncbi:MAG: hypothetical protein HC878_00230 [Leptolyngbyaceae cyanobacterium SL_5_14]|nr:hypothetical protein [Leptolyngbyaceae cyanobacterium SL_5_14]
MTQRLVQYLAALDSSEEMWGLWVDPENPDDFRLGQYIFDNGGLNDGKVDMGSLSVLSCGNQDAADAIRQWLKDRKGVFQYGDRRVSVNIHGVMMAHHLGTLDDDFLSFLEASARPIQHEWADLDAEHKVSEFIASL